MGNWKTVGEWRKSTDFALVYRSLPEYTQPVGNDLVLNGRITCAMVNPKQVNCKLACMPAAERGLAQAAHRFGYVGLMKHACV